MAKAKKCDRCGQYYDDNKINIPDSLIGRSSLTNAYIPMKFIIKARSGAPGVIADMCDSCFEDLFDWLGYDSSKLPPEENPPVEPSEPEEGTDEIKPPANPEDNGSDQ